MGKIASVYDTARSMVASNVTTIWKLVRRTPCALTIMGTCSWPLDDRVNCTPEFNPRSTSRGPGCRFGAMLTSLYIVGSQATAARMDTAEW